MDAGSGLDVWSTRRGNLATVVARGDLDFATVPKLVEAVKKVVGDGITACTLDFERVTFIDSETVKTVIALRRKLARSHIPMDLQNCARQVARILDLLGVADQIGWACNCEHTGSSK